MTIFEQVREAIDMRSVVEGYGLHISRSGMCLCPFHNESNPSAKIYPQNLFCFGCGISVDVISFTQRMFGLEKPIDAVKKLNEDYGLHIVIGKAPTRAEVTEYQMRIARRKAYEIWENKAWRTLVNYLWLMREWRELAPRSPDDKFDDRFVYSLHHLDYAEYLCDEFIRADKQGRISMKNIVSETADFMEHRDTIR